MYCKFVKIDNKYNIKQNKLVIGTRIPHIKNMNTRA